MSLAIVQPDDDPRRRADDARRARHARIDALAVDRRHVALHDRTWKPRSAYGTAMDERLKEWRDGHPAPRLTTLRRLLADRGWCTRVYDYWFR